MKLFEEKNELIKLSIEITVSYFEKGVEILGLWDKLTKQNSHAK